MSSIPYLITGIPRSGTTLCCKLLNQQSEVIALHEPIEPASIPHRMTNLEAVGEVDRQVGMLSYAIQNGLPFAHGDDTGLQIDNPVGNKTKYGIREVVAKRGQIQLTIPSDDFTLIVKQNALFTALLSELKKSYPVVCIVRNPVDVLLSWMTVNLPVNRGHIPAGERFDRQLKLKLPQLSLPQRQLTIYQWFVDQFLNSGLPIVRYEDVIATSGQCLDSALKLPVLERDTLSSKAREFESKTINQLSAMKQGILNLNCGELYSKDDILTALSKYKL